MVDAATRAYRYRERLTDRERHLVDAEYHVVVTQDSQRRSPPTTRSSW